MNPKKRKAAAGEWAKIRKDHPAFARVFIIQQLLLMHAAEQGVKAVDRYICKMLRDGLPLIFWDYWVLRCKKKHKPLPPLPGIFKCLNEKQNPGDCFNLPGDDEWLKDPFADHGMNLDYPKSIPGKRAFR
jgi:hypothetical protein